MACLTTLKSFVLLMFILGPARAAICYVRRYQYNYFYRRGGYTLSSYYCTYNYNTYGSDTSYSSDDSTGLSTGAIVGIVSGCVFLFLVIGLTVGCCNSSSSRTSAPAARVTYNKKQKAPKLPKMPKIDSDVFNVEDNVEIPEATQPEIPQYEEAIVYPGMPPSDPSFMEMPPAYSYEGANMY